MRSPDLSDHIAATIREDPSRLVACSFLTEDGPLPVWWKPTHWINIDFEGQHETFYLKPGEPDKIYYIRDEEFSHYFR